MHDTLSHYLVTSNELTRYRVSHGILGALVCVTMFNPIFVIRSTLLGVLLGDIMYLKDQGIGQSRSHKNGFSIFTPDATEADRINVKNHQLLAGHSMEFHDAYTLTPNWKSV